MKYDKIIKWVLVFLFIAGVVTSFFGLLIPPITTTPKRTARIVTAANAYAQ